MEKFTGLTQDAYRFMFEIALRNDKAFFEENRRRYEQVLKRPMLQLAGELAQAALEVDPAFQVNPVKVVSRIHRDTRFSKDKSPYRDHVFFSYKHMDKRISESFVLYTEFEKNSYGYGMGMYCPQPAFMEQVRGRILARPSLFLELVDTLLQTSKFVVQGADYKKTKCPDAPPALWPWLDKKMFSFCYFSPAIERTMTPALVEEIKAAFQTLTPLYRFIQGIS